MGDRQASRRPQPPTPARGAADPALPWRAPPREARHKLTVWCPVALRADLDTRARALRDTAGGTGPLATVASINDFVALACHQLCESVEARYGQPLPPEVSGAVQLGPLSLGPAGDLGTPRYSLPWDRSADEPIERITVRIPYPLNDRLRRLERWLARVRIDGHPATTVISKRNDLACLAIHHLLTQTPDEPTAPGTPAIRARRARVQLSAVVPPDLPGRLHGLRDWLRSTDAAALAGHDSALAELDSMSGLVTLACEQLCTQVERRHNRGRPFTPRQRRTG